MNRKKKFATEKNVVLARKGPSAVRSERRCCQCGKAKLMHRNRTEVTVAVQTRYFWRLRVEQDRTNPSLRSEKQNEASSTISNVAGNMFTVGSGRGNLKFYVTAGRRNPNHHFGYQIFIDVMSEITPGSKCSCVPPVVMSAAVAKNRNSEDYTKPAVS